jgi:hypothetical protein
MVWHLPTVAMGTGTGITSNQLALLAAPVSSDA